MIQAAVLLGILGGQELLFILVIVLVLFGGKKIPELMRGLGKGVGEFKKGKNEVMDSLDDTGKPGADPTSSSTPKPE